MGAVPGRSTESLGMTKNFVKLAAVLCAIPVTGFCADDSVRVEFDGGMPMASVSGESINFEVVRRFDSFRRVDGDVDRFFATVREILESCSISRDWSRVAPDASTVRVIVTLDNKTIVLTTSSFRPRSQQDREAVPSVCRGPSQNESERGMFAVRAIVDLGVARIRAKVDK